MRRLRYGQPYRGQYRPKVRGRPSPPKPYEKAITTFFWGLMYFAGAVILLVAIMMAQAGNFVGGFVFCLYLMFFLIAFFAFGEAKQMKMLTPDEDEGQIENKHEQAEDEGAVLLEDYLAQVEWGQTHRRSHFSAHDRRHEPAWRYRRVSAAGRGIRKDGSLWLVAIAFGVVLVAVLVANIFGLNSPLTIIILITLGLLGVGVYLFVQEMKN